MRVFFLPMLAMLVCLAAPSLAQSPVWLQIEARSGADQAIAAAEDYAGRIDGVATFRMSTGWHAIVVGPFDPGEATVARRNLQARGLIPQDSFATDGGRFRERIWPEDRSAAVTAPQGEPEEPEADSQPAPTETPAEARRSERNLSAASRRKLQRALEWAGFYNAGIDGAFGRGTRAAMRDWQAANGYDATGILTTTERSALIRDYDSVLDGLGMDVVRDDTAGISIRMPTESVAFADYQPPFARYDARSDGDRTRVILISQRGGRPELGGLYDVMQTLEIIPPDGERERRGDSFTLTGRNDDIASHTEAWVDGETVKGFVLVWPAGDEDRRRRVVYEMRESFETLAAVLPDQMGAPTESQSVDLLSGLRVRTPDVSRSGFYVGRQGQVLTTADAADGCRIITLDDDIEATVIARDAAMGLAVLEPSTPLAPRHHARFLDAVPRLGADAILAGFSFDGALGAPSLTYGALAEMTGLGDETLRRYDLSHAPGDLGGPVLDRSGAVLGLLVEGPRRDQVLPDGTAFAADVETLARFLSETGLEVDAQDPGPDLPRGTLERLATDMTVLVGCWK